ncbi:Norsolorinic acid synthase [Dirofilaria immitis]
MRTKNQIRTRALSNVWNTSHYLTKKHRNRRESVRKPGSENRLSSAGNIMNKEHRKNEKLGGGEEAESRFQICNTDHKNTKLEIRFD